MAQIKCEAIVSESSGRGGLGRARHCSFAAKWDVEGKKFCTIHKNAELRLFYDFDIQFKPLYS